MKAIKLGAALAVLVAALVGPAQAETSGNYSNQTPYGNPASTPIVTPTDTEYKMFFIETVGRHGSRAMTSTGAETRSLSVWKNAKSKGALTTAGKKFEADLKAFQAAEKAVGYGRLSDLGKAEWEGIGRRTAANYEDFFVTMASTERIERVRTSYSRTQESATAMRDGLDNALSGLKFATTTTDVARLELSSGSTTQGRAAIAKVKKLDAVRTSAKNVLRRMYTAKYVDSLSDPVGNAQDLYLLYCTGAAMRDHTSVTFARYFTSTDALKLAYVKDTENFYRYGPGVSGQTSSYKQATSLLNDFFRRLQIRTSGGEGSDVAALFRFAHGETTMPLAALIKAPGSQMQVPSNRYFTYSNPWRGKVAGVPAGSIEWVAYKKAGSPVLVTMRYNEKPVGFRGRCTPVERYFYTVTELKSCLL